MKIFWMHFPQVNHDDDLCVTYVSKKKEKCGREDESSSGLKTGLKIDI